MSVCPPRSSPFHHTHTALQAWESLQAARCGQPVLITGTTADPDAAGTEPLEVTLLASLALLPDTGFFSCARAPDPGALVVGTVDPRVLCPPPGAPDGADGGGGDGDSCASPRATDDPFDAFVAWLGALARPNPPGGFRANSSRPPALRCAAARVTPLPYVAAEAVTLAADRLAAHPGDDGPARLERLLASGAVASRMQGFPVMTDARVLIQDDDGTGTMPAADAPEAAASGPLVARVVATVPASAPGAPVCVTGRTVLSIAAPEATAAKGNGPPGVVPRPRLAGLDAEFANLCDLVRLPLQHAGLFGRLGLECPKGILLYGPPGTGKTLLVKSVAEECGAHFTVVNGPELFAPYLGESEANLRRVFGAAVARAERAPAVLFLDEIDALCPRRDDNKSHENRMVAQLLTLMDGLVSRGRLVVVAATNRPNVLDPALRRPGRFDREMEIASPSAEQREAILRFCTRGLQLHPGVDFADLAAQTVGYVGADLAALTREAALRGVRRLALADEPPASPASSPSPLSSSPLASGTVGIANDGACISDPAQSSTGEPAVVERRDFDAALSTTVASAHRSSKLNISPTAWDDIGGLGEVKDKLMQAAIWPLLYPETYAKLGITPPRGILLHGPPGCAKTTLARALASSARASFYSLSGAEVLSPYLGDAERTIRDLFKKARSTAPAIIFLDEIDAMVGNRSQGSDSSGVQERVLATLLTEMDGVEAAGHVLIVGATNRPDMLDAAFTRPGRIDQSLYIPLPDVEARLSILKIKTAKMPLDGLVDLNALANQTNTFSGADLENLCREAAILALRMDITTEVVRAEHLQAALDSLLQGRAVA